MMGKNQWCSGPARPERKVPDQAWKLWPDRADFQRKLSNLTLHNYRSVEQLIWLGRVCNKSILSNFWVPISQIDGLYLLFVIWLSANVPNSNTRELYLLFRSAGPEGKYRAQAGLFFDKISGPRSGRALFFGKHPGPAREHHW